MKKIALLVPVVLHGIGASVAVVLAIGFAQYISDHTDWALFGAWEEPLKLAIAAVFFVGVFATFIWSILSWSKGGHVRSALISACMTVVVAVGLSATYIVFARELEQGFMEAEDEYLQATRSPEVPYGEDGRPLPPLFDPQVSYQCDFLNGDVTGETGTTTNGFGYALSDDKETMDFSLETIFFNYHTCNLSGTARRDEFTSDRSEEHYIFVEDTGYFGYCILDISINKQNDLVLTDISPTFALGKGYGRACSSYCGARGSIGGTFHGSYLAATSTNASCIF